MKDYGELWRGANYSIIAHTVKANIKKGFDHPVVSISSKNSNSLLPINHKNELIVTIDCGKNDSISSKSTFQH